MVCNYYVRRDVDTHTESLTNKLPELVSQTRFGHSSINNVVRKVNYAGRTRLQKMNARKTKVMIMGDENANVSIYVVGETIAKENSFKYIGAKYIKTRIGRAKKATMKLDIIGKDRGIRKLSKKVEESRLKSYGHVLRREDEYEGVRVMGMEVPRKRRRGRPKRRWLYSIRNDLSEREFFVRGGRARPG